MKDICSVKDIVKRIERQVTHWQKIFTKLVSNKGLVSKKQKTKRKKPAQLKKKTVKRSEQAPHERRYTDRK